MEKSLAKTDQTSAKAAAVIATKPAMPARRAVSARRSGEMRADCPVDSRRRAKAPAKRLYAASARAMRRAKLPKVAMRTPVRFSHAGRQAFGPSSKHILNHLRLGECDLPHTIVGD